jgi:hypothetical protein
VKALLLEQFLTFLRYRYITQDRDLRLGPSQPEGQTMARHRYMFGSEHDSNVTQKHCGVSLASLCCTKNNCSWGHSSHVHDTEDLTTSTHNCDNTCALRTDQEVTIGLHGHIMW